MSRKFANRRFSERLHQNNTLVEVAELMYVRNGRVACVIDLAGFEGEAATPMPGL
jgi:hypothetical protein